MQSTNIQQLLDQADSAPSNVQAYADHIIKNEGGFIDTPYDPGGATNYGLSFRFVNLYGNLFDLNHDGKLTIDDIRLITPQIARAAFIVFFYYRYKINLLPVSIQINAFDAAVNMGPATAVTIAQDAYNSLVHRGLIHSAPIATDGNIGPTTAQAMSVIPASMGDLLNETYSNVRIQAYKNIVKTNPRSEMFLNGWINRVQSLT